MAVSALVRGRWDRGSSLVRAPSGRPPSVPSDRTYQLFLLMGGAVPDRIIRDELLESERWLSLRDNSARICFIALLLKADPFGNLEANPHRLMRLWRDFGIKSPQQVSSTLAELQDCDLIRLYEADSKQFLHIPRFRQNLRFVKRIHPLSPWTTLQQKQRLAQESPGAHPVGTALAHSAHGRSEVKRSEEKRSEVPVPVDKAFPTSLENEVQRLCIKCGKPANLHVNGSYYCKRDAP